MPTPPVLMVVDPSIEMAEDEAIATAAAGWPGEVDVRLPALRPGDGPAPGDPWPEAVVVLGSGASVHDDRPWLDDLVAWLDPLIEGGTVPLLGLCFGHQLLAHVAGGRVGFVRDDRGKVTGVGTTEIVGSRLLSGRHRLLVTLSHREMVVELPPGFETVARRDGVAIDGMQHVTGPLFGFQFHPEARGEFAGRRGIDLAGVEERIARDGDLVLEGFRRLAWQHVTRDGARASAGDGR